MGSGWDWHEIRRSGSRRTRLFSRGSGWSAYPSAEGNEALKRHNTHNIGHLEEFTDEHALLNRLEYHTSNPQATSVKNRHAPSGVPRAINEFNCMKLPICGTLALPLFGLTAALLTGCASTGVQNPSGVPVTQMQADEQGFVAGPGIESQDVVTVADKMARGILGIPQIANARTAPRVVLLPVKNETRFPINKEIFLREIRATLNERAAGKVIFLARDRMADLERERELKQSGQVTSSTDPNVNQFRGADFMLTGELTGLSSRMSAGMSDYVLYSFQLLDPTTSDIIWEGSHRIKKQSLEDAAYR